MLEILNKMCLLALKIFLSKQTVYTLKKYRIMQQKHIGGTSVERVKILTME